MTDTAENAAGDSGTDQAGPATFTEAVSQMEAAGYNSMGFTIEGDRVVCVECGEAHPEASIGLGGMLRYANESGEGHVFALACPDCQAKGLMFEAADATVGPTSEIVDALTARARR